MRVTQKASGAGEGTGRQSFFFLRLSGNAAQFLCGSLFVATLSPGLASSNIFLFGLFFSATFCRCRCRFRNVTRCDKDNDDGDGDGDDVEEEDGNVASAMYKIRTIAICNKNMQFFVIVICGFYRTLTQIGADTHAGAPCLMPHGACHVPHRAGQCQSQC